MDQLPNTIEECHALIRLLLNKLDEFSQRISVLEAENRDLKERLNINSSNSSLPPSKSPKKKKNTTRKPSGKKAGGQSGHKGHYRKLLPVEQVDFTKSCSLPEHCECGGKIKLLPEVVRHQVHELPELKLDVTEYQLERGCCDTCHCKKVASLPEGVTWGITGPRLTGFMSELIAKYGLSRSELKVFLKDIFDFDLSKGTIFNKQKIVTAALEAPVAELLPIVKESISINADETGHNRDGGREWLWGFISPVAAYFLIHSSRGKKVLRQIIGDFVNIVISDRYIAYTIFDSSQRQVCWAHLKRDFTKLSEKKDKIIARIGKNLLECESNLFEIWHQFKCGFITRGELQEEAEPIRQRVYYLLEQGSYTDPALKAVGFCKNLLGYFDALWTFLEIEGVEPTNNHAERCLRPFVIWRKKYFCTRSDYGSDFVARIASIITTCKLNGKSSFEFLATLLDDYFSGKQTPAQLLLT
jgi:transposase